MEMATPDLSYGWLFIKMILAMGVVIGLAIVLIRYVLPRMTLGRGSTGTSIRIIERAGLEPRKGLYLIEVEGKRVLIGTSDQRITKLMDLTPESKP